jgi:hypothetical protein
VGSVRRVGVAAPVGAGRVQAGQVVAAWCPQGLMNSWRPQSTPHGVSFLLFQGRWAGKWGFWTGGCCRRPLWGAPQLMYVGCAAGSAAGIYLHRLLPPRLVHPIGQQASHSPFEVWRLSGIYPRHCMRSWIPSASLQASLGAGGRVDRGTRSCTH